MMSSSSSTSKTLQLTSDNKGMKTEIGKFTLLPEDLVLNILSRLSVKDVLRSRPVCKEWSLLSRTGRFISLHTNRSNSQKRNVNGHGFCSSSFILLRSVYDDETDSGSGSSSTEGDDDLSYLEAYKTIYGDQMSLDRNSSVLLTFITLEKTRNGKIQCIEKEDVTLESIFPSDAGLPLPSDNESIQICSPFDGLMCLAYGSKIYLYNPATREVLRLPSPPDPKSEFEIQSRVLCVWFESESTAKHYKVFRMVCSKVANNNMVQVYDSIKNRWSVIMTIAGRAYPWISVLFNGVVYFYMEKEKDSYVERGYLVTIDVKSEETGHIELPFINLHYNESALLPFCGKLAFLQPSKEDGDDNVFVKIWVMSTEDEDEDEDADEDEEEEEDLEKEGAWTLQYTILVDDIDPDDETTGHTYGTFLYYPLSFWNCMQDENEEGAGIELLVRTYLGRIVSCNLVTERINDLDLRCIPSCTAMIVPNNKELLLSLSKPL